MRRALIISAIVVGLAGLAIGYVASIETIDVRVRQAMIAGAVVAAGWVITFLLQEYRFYRERRERMNDVQKALYAEIRAYLEGQLKRDDLQVYGSEMVARMRDAADEGVDYVPLIPTETNDMIFKAIVPEIHILPRISIDPVVVYYSQISAIHAIIHDLRSEAYQALHVDRRIAMYQDYISLKQEAITLGEDALKVMERVSRYGARKAERSDRA